MNTEYKDKYLRYKKKYYELRKKKLEYQKNMKDSNKKKIIKLDGGSMDGSDVYEVDCKIELVKNDKGGNFSLDRLGISSKEMMEDPNKIRKFYITYGKIANIFKIAATKDK